MKSPLRLATLFLLPATLALSQPAAKPVSVVLETERGVITLEVDVARAPITAANFLHYVDGKFYDGGLIDRAVRPDNTRRHDIEIQVIQLQSNPARKGELAAPIPLERTTQTGLKHVNGTLSMARDGSNTATSSFFITIGDQPSLDFGGKRNPDGQGFAAFGRIVEGMDVVKEIQAAPTGKDGEFGTETLAPPIKILRAYRAKP